MIPGGSEDLTTSKAPPKAGLVIPGTKVSTGNGQLACGVMDGKKQTDVDIFTSVVGVDNGALYIKTHLVSYN